jgi:hypothetical protein
MRNPASIASVVLGLTAAAFAVPSHSFIVSIDEFSVLRNGTQFFFDTFNDGVPPPSAPNFTAGGAATYNVSGTFPSGSESGGRLQLNTANGAISANALEQPRIEVRARLQTDIDPANLSAGLKSDDTLVLRGIFSLTTPSGIFNPQYSIRFNDNAGAGAHQILQLQVRRDTTNNLTEIRYILQDFDLNTITVLGSAPFAPPVSADEILLEISRPSTANNNFFASYSYLASGSNLGTFGFLAPGLGFQGENFVRAEFNAADGFLTVNAVPEPSTPWLLGVSALLLGIAGRKRTM